MPYPRHSLGRAILNPLQMVSRRILQPLPADWAVDLLQIFPSRDIFFSINLGKYLKKKALKSRPRITQTKFTAEENDLLIKE